MFEVTCRLKYHMPETLKDGVECCESHYGGVLIIGEEKKNMCVSDSMKF